MNVSTILWKVVIDYEKPVKVEGKKVRRETFEEAYLFLNTKDDTLRVTDKKYRGPDRIERSLLLTRAKIVELSPWSAWFEAFWWEGHPLGSKKKGYKRLVKATIKADF